MLNGIVPKGKQFEIMNLEMKGHNVVTGSAGSGKSTCALWRAKAIVNRLNEGVHLLTYNNTLSNYLNNLVVGEDKNRIKITTFHKVVARYLRNIGMLFDDDILGDKKYNQYAVTKSDLLKDAIKAVKRIYKNNTTLSRENFIKEEICWMQKVGCLTLDTYENITRHGRGTARLDRTNRKYVFMVYEKYIELREKRGFSYDWDDIAFYANEFLKSNPPKHAIKHVIIDEGQDFSPMMIKFLVNYVGDTGSITFFTDSAQQIFGSNGTWKSSGLKIKKAYKLDQNYRNSLEIERFANEIRNGIHLDETDVLKSENAVSKGILPTVYEIKGSNKELESLIYVLKKHLKDGTKVQSSIAILTATNECRDEAFKYLKGKGFESKLIDRLDPSFKGENGIYIGTYHSAKGLEFDDVILYRCSELDFNCEALNEQDVLEKKDEIEKALKLLYVGATRARVNLSLIYTGFLPKGFPTNKALEDGKELYSDLFISYEEEEHEN